MNIQMELRKCCNHPFLINGVEQIEMENLEGKLEETANKVSDRYARSKLLFDQTEFERRRMNEVLIPSSGKMVLLNKLLPKLLKEGHKVLIFSQMVKMIDVIEEFCNFCQYSVARLDGRVSGNDRQKSIDKFNTDPNSFVFLLSTRAGGVGINLTAADTVIIFDSDWNPQNDIQAMARCHRIGQSKNVKIYRLITRRSFEADMFERASKKLGLEQAVLGTRNFNEIDWDETTGKPAGSSTANMDAKEMEKLLREGAYSLLIEGNDFVRVFILLFLFVSFLDDGEQMKEFYEQDIEQILEHRAHVLVESNPQGGTESWLNKRKKSGRTNKRMFTGESAKEHAEIDVDDPDFWKKVLPDLVTPDTMLERLGNDDDLKNTSCDDEDRDIVEKFMKDLAQMMDGMLDLSRRSQLPEHERAICFKLLLQMTLNPEIFTEEEIEQANEWLSMMEGTRSRRGRQEIYKVEDFSTSRGKNRSRGGSATTPKSSGKNTPGGRSRGRPKLADSDLDLDEDEEDDEVTSNKKGRKSSNKKATTPKTSASRKKSASKYFDEDDEDEEDRLDYSAPSSRRNNKHHGSDDEFGDGDDDDEEALQPKKRKRQPSLPRSSSTSSINKKQQSSSAKKSSKTELDVASENIIPSGKKRQRKSIAKTIIDEEEDEEDHYLDDNMDDDDIGSKKKRSRQSSSTVKKRNTPKSR
jgi:hypothetical protein